MVWRASVSGILEVRMLEEARADGDFVACWNIMDIFSLWLGLAFDRDRFGMYLRFLALFATGVWVPAWFVPNSEEDVSFSYRPLRVTLSAKESWVAEVSGLRSDLAVEDVFRCIA